MIKLNFGCGKKILRGFVNIDVNKKNGCDLVVDLEKTPYNFKVNYADYILCDNVLEHIHFPSKAIDEFHRIVKPSGEIKIIVPHFTNSTALFGDVHVCAFTAGYFYMRDEKVIKEIDSWAPDNRLFKDVKVKLIFPEGKFKIISLPFQLLFGRNKTMQFLYEQFFSGFYRADRLEITLKNKI